MLNPTISTNNFLLPMIAKPFQVALEASSTRPPKRIKRRMSQLTCRRGGLSVPSVGVPWPIKNQTKTGE